MQYMESIVWPRLMIDEDFVLNDNTVHQSDP